MISMFIAISLHRGSPAIYIENEEWQRDYYRRTTPASVGGLKCLCLTEECREVPLLSVKNKFMKELTSIEVRLYATLLKILRDESTAWDVLQQLYLDFSGLNEAEILNIKSVTGYAIESARRAAFQKLRSARRSPIEFVEHLQDLPERYLQDWSQDLHAMAEADQDFTLLLYEIYEVLPPKCREVVILSRIFQLTAREISVRMGIGEQTVKNHLQLALKHSKDTLNQDGVSHGALLLLQLLERKGQ